MKNSLTAEQYQLVLDWEEVKSQWHALEVERMYELGVKVGIRSLYGTENQQEYDAVVKIAKEALADLDSIEVPQGYLDYLYKGSPDPNLQGKGFYDMEFRGAEKSFKHLLEAGISPDSIVHRLVHGQRVIA